MDPNRYQDERLSRQFTQAVTASDLEEVDQLDVSQPSTPLSFMEERERSDEQAFRDIADPVGIKALFLAALDKEALDKDQDHDGAEAKALNESSKSEQALNEAMKAGFVRMNITNLLILGMAGTGKTSTKHLLLGLPPPRDRNSTPLASTAERACFRQIRDTSTLKIEVQEDPSRTWKSVTSDDLQRIVADAIKSYVSSSDPKASAIPQELGVALKQIEARNESGTEVDTICSAARASPTKLSVAGAKTTPTKQESNNVMANIKRLSDDDSAAVQEKFGSHWIYLIDSGGQPQFHNLLPLFVPKISVALYILRLSDYLGDHPLVEYYKDSMPVGEGFKSHLSVLDNFKYLVQSIQSHSENCKLVCIGTHKDHQSECKETLSDKNKTLLNFAEKDSIKNLTMFFNLGLHREIIFPVDCKHYDSDSKEVAKTIREYIHKLFQSHNNEVLVPFWWFVLEIVVDKVSSGENRKVLSKNECVEIAKTLHNFHEDSLCEALKFFHEHHIFHYYPAILPNVVFCDTQVLLDKVTELVEFATYVRGGNTPIHGLRNFTDKGIITIELLSDKNFEKHYVDGLFSPTDLIEIFKHLLIAIPFCLFSRGVTQDERFYMPSILSLLPPTEVNDKRADLLKTGLIPLVLHFKSNWQCCGVFCCLQVYLIKECEWEIEMEDHQPSRNFVQLIHQKQNCFMTLIDSFLFLEIHSSSNRKEMLSLIYENVHSGLRSAYKALKYTYEDPEIRFLCPHGSPTVTSASPHHLARVMAMNHAMRCTQFKKMTYNLEDGHKDWLSACHEVKAHVRTEPQESELTEVSTADYRGEIPEINVNSAPIDIEEELITTQSHDIEPGDQVEASPQDETIIDIDYDADNESGDKMDTAVVAAQGAQPSVDTGAIGTMRIINGELNQAVAETSDEVLEVVEERVPHTNLSPEAIANEVEAVQVVSPVEPHGIFSIFDQQSFITVAECAQRAEVLTDNEADEILYDIWERLQYESSIVTYRYDIFQKQFLSIVASHKHRSVCKAIQFLPYLPFITPVEVFQVTSAGGVYKDDSLGISITVPEGAVPDFTIFPIEVGTCLYGPFQFVEESTRIAPILMLCPQKNIPLNKPITVTLPHLLTEATESDIESFNIRVVKADHKSLLFPDFDLNKCLFEDIDPCESCISFDNRNSITFSVSHFCFLSILGDLKRNANKIGYCIYPLIHRDMNVISYRLCVTFFMAPFIKEFVKQFLRHGHEVLQHLSPKPISFKHKQSNIEANIEKGISQPGWLVYLSDTDYDDVQIISAKSVLDVLEKEANDVEKEIEFLVYPPSFQINANGQQATAPANVKVHFKTDSREFCWTLPLDLAASFSKTSSEVALGERTSTEQPLTLDFLQSQYTLDLHIEERIESEDRAILAQKFRYNKILCFVNYIRLNPSRQSDVSTAHHTMGAAAAMTMALEFWSNMNPYIATFKNLLLHLLKQTEGEIAMAVCDHLFKRANKQVEKCAKQVHYSNGTLESDEAVAVTTDEIRKR